MILSETLRFNSDNGVHEGTVFIFDLSVKDVFY